MFLRVRVVDGEVGSNFIRDVQVDDPVHEVEAGEANWKDDSRIFVDGGRRSAKHFVQILALNDQSQIQVVHDCCHLNRHSSTRSVVLALCLIKE